MKKFAKMSLVAAVAVAGLTNVNAASLEEAIKGVDVSGQFRYRMEERNVEGDAGQNTKTDVEVEVTAKVPVNDNVTAIFKVDYALDEDDGANSKNAFNLEDYYFQYVNGALTVNFGQQNIPGRLTDGDQGDGLVALYNAGAFTVGAAAFKDNTVTGATTDMLTSVMAMGSVGPVSLFGQYVNVQDALDAYNLKADAKVGPVMLGLEWADLELDDELASTNQDDRSTFKAYVSGSMDIVSAKLTYAQTGDNGSGSIDNQFQTNTETASEFLLWNLGTATNPDMDVWALDVSVAVTDKISLRAAYADGEIGDASGNDVEEILGQVSYKMSSNLDTYIRYSQFDNSGTSDVDTERARVEVRYSF